MKRSQSINLNRMRKTSKRFLFKPLTLAITATLVACSDSQDAKVYQDAEHCKEDNPSLTQQCEAAYQKALAESASSGPKYNSQRDCSVDFGRDNCVPYTSPQGQNWFIPAMAGFMFSQMINRNDYHYAPLYTSYSRRSPFYDRWTTVDGNVYGRKRYGSLKVDKKVFNPKPKVTRTISRGGFGSTVSAKSRWGGKSSRSSWGG